MDAAARQIRQRIIGIILRAFIGVVLVTLLLIFIVIAVAVSTSVVAPPFERLPLVARLEGYYEGRGSWQGVQSTLAADSTGSESVLLDAEGLVVVERGRTDTPRAGLPYQAGAHDVVVRLNARGRMVGTLVFDRDAVSSVSSRSSPLYSILLPVGLASTFLALLAAVVIAMLSRRIVTPLAEVIAAARAVTAGRLDARVQVQGPQDLLALTEGFNQMAAALERNDRERRELLADVAHELRTPISAIRGRLEGMLDGIYPADASHISLALKANYLLERLVEDLRLLTLAESRQLRFEKKETDLKTVAAHAVEMFGAAAQEKDVQIELLSAPGDFVAILDPQRTEQILGNMLGNALRYAPSGGRVWLALERTGSAITISVCDNGPGVPEGDLPYIFDRFWRKDKSRARHTGGSGLGLAIARQLAEAQGGRLSAENLAGGGLKVQWIVE